MNRLILFTAILATFAAPGFAEIFDLAQWVVYDSSDHGRPELTPEQTLSLLMDLKFAVKNIPFAEKRRTIIANILRVADVNQDHCKDFKFMMILVRTYDRNKMHERNILPYMQHYIPQQFQLCSKHITEQFERLKTKVVEEDLKKLESLLSYMKLPKDGARMTATQIGRGVAWYADARRKQSVKLWFLRTGCKMGLESDFKIYVKDFCERLDKIFWPIMYLPMIDLALIGGVDPQIYEYMRKILIVHNIASDERNIIRHMRKTLEVDDPDFEQNL